MHIESKYLKVAALTAAGPKDLRTYLQGVLLRVHAGHVVIAATDGARLTAIRQELTDVSFSGGVRLPPGEYIVPLHVIKSIKGAIVSFNFVPNDAGKMEMTDGSMTTAFEPVEGKFPRVNRVLPEKETSGATASYKTSYLADAGKASKLLGESDGKSVRVYQNGDAPGVVKFQDENVALIIMPFRTTEEATTKLFASRWTEKLPGE